LLPVYGTSSTYERSTGTALSADDARQKEKAFPLSGVDTSFELQLLTYSNLLTYSKFTDVCSSQRKKVQSGLITVGPDCPVLLFFRILILIITEDGVNSLLQTSLFISIPTITVNATRKTRVLDHRGPSELALRSPISMLVVDIR